MTTSKTQNYEYQTEAKKLLNIVIHSLYTNRDIFVRELISNASDAIEKLRYLSLTEKDYLEKDLPLEININVDKESKTITITDSGVGMSREELIENLGTIAHSSTEKFFENIQEKGEQEKSQLIGQFGVGFYSAFMVGTTVTVISRSYKTDSKGWEWTSDGISNYTIAEKEDATRGTKIIVELNEESEKYLEIDTLKQIIKEYSNFVSSPIKIGDDIVNTIKPIWTRSPKDVSEEEYKEFYKFHENAMSDPFFQLHTASDAPIQLNALLYFPKENMEVFGFNRTEPGVGIYCNKILIQNKVKEILPEYMRFIKGIVDSEDLPLNINRETLQDNLIIGKLKKFLTKRIISFLKTQAKENLVDYMEFYKVFAQYLKEGANSDWENSKEIASLLYFESMKTESGKLLSLDEYVAAMPEDQKEIYYLTGNSREEIESSPYLETFKANEVDVLFLFDPIDDFVMTSVKEYSDKKLVSADQSAVDLKGDKKDESKDKESEKSVDTLLKWLKKELDERLSDIKLSTRLVNSPALIVNPDDAMTTHMQKIMESSKNEFYQTSKKVLEINSEHELITKIAELQKSKDGEDKARLLMDQVIDNAFVSAGLKVDQKKMIDRIHKLMLDS